MSKPSPRALKYAALHYPFPSLNPAVDSAGGVRSAFAELIDKAIVESVAALVADNKRKDEALRQLIGHWDAVIASEGSEFSCGCFDHVKDTLEDARELLEGKK